MAEELDKKIKKQLCRESVYDMRGFMQSCFLYYFSVFTPGIWRERISRR